ncbi:MAG: hypothetical protein RLZZ297_907 [Chloroflexota bacterium]
MNVLFRTLQVLFGFAVLVIGCGGALWWVPRVTAAPTPTPTTGRVSTGARLPRMTVIGRSVEGRPIEAYHFGAGERKLVFVGATHGGPERNTQQLARMLIDWYSTHPEEIPVGVRLDIIPVLNPDGDVRDSRQNANGVDLNRNMDTSRDGCVENDWQTTVYGAGGILVDTGGPYADSEPESRVIRSYLLDAAAVIFVHSDAGLVFPPACEDPVSIAFAQAYAAGAGYEYARYWDKYHITGGMHDWARGVDLPAVIPELLTGEDPEFEQNLNGMRAVFHNADVLIPAPSFRTVDGVTMPLPIWRFWRAHGADIFGPPLQSAALVDGRYIQEFATARVAYDSTTLVDTVTLLPVTSVAEPGSPVAALDDADRITNATNPFVVLDAFARFYRRVDGETTLGIPLSDEQTVEAAAPDTTVQRFEFGVLRYDSAANRIVREPVVWQEAARTALSESPLQFQIR